MKDKIEDTGGPAFPCTRPVMAPSQTTAGALDKVGEQFHNGLTIRDFFAASALISMRTHPANEQPQHIGDWSFKVADAMLEARKK